MEIRFPLYIFLCRFIYGDKFYKKDANFCLINSKGLTLQRGHGYIVIKEVGVIGDIILCVLAQNIGWCRPVPSGYLT